MPTFTFELNGEVVAVDAPSDMAMLWVLRDKLGVTGPKYGCGLGVCRSCTSHLNGEAFQPCITPVADCAGQQVTTIEGLADGEALHPVQQAFLDCGATQCGYCTPGMIMAAVALLDGRPEPTRDEIARGMHGNVCRCGTYTRIVAAVETAAREMKGGAK